MYVIGTLPVLLTFKYKINFVCSLLNVVFVTFIKILHMYVADFISICVPPFTFCLNVYMIDNF
jgi:hypothetical protein